MLVTLEILLTLFTCIISTITDIRNKKIYNKIIIVTNIVAIILYVLFYKQIEISFIRQHVFNILTTIIISFMFFYFNIWAAGDAKLFITLSVCIPVQLFERNPISIFPSELLLILIFSSAFIYILFETIYLFIKDKSRFEKNESDNKSIKETITNFVLTTSVLTLINNILFYLLPKFMSQNIILSIIISMFIGISLNEIKDKKEIIIIVTLLLNIVLFIIAGVHLTWLNLIYLLVSMITMEFRKVSGKYNYKEIETNKVQVGMILSVESSILFRNSRVKNLPGLSTEQTDSRLKDKEVDAIKRWAKTKKGINHMIIVKYIPFAPFMLLGYIEFIILKVIL